MARHTQHHPDSAERTAKPLSQRAAAQRERGTATRVLQFTRERSTAAVLHAGRTLPHGRKNMPNRYIVDEAGRGRRTPLLAATKAALKEAPDLRALASAGAAEDALVRLVAEAVLPLTLELDRVAPLPAVFTLHVAETRVQGRLDVAVNEALSADTFDAWETVLDLVEEHRAALDRLGRRVVTDLAHRRLGQGTRVAPLPPAVQRLAHEDGTDTNGAA